MDVNSEILQSIETYPSIFPYRYAVMDHLFLTIGNGYEWVNGELVSDCDYPYSKEKWTEVQWRKQFGTSRHGRYPDGDHRNEILKASFEARLEKEIIELQSIVDNALERSRDVISLPQNFYPGSIKYSRICIFPDDITDSWKKAIIEFHDRVHQPDAERVNYYENARELTAYAVERLK